jgi:hypothetical protein
MAERNEIEDLKTLTLVLTVKIRRPNDLEGESWLTAEESVHAYIFG